MELKKIGVIDIFSGIGGLSYGLKGANLPIIAGIDADPTCKFAYTQNIEAQFFVKDVNLLTGNHLNELFSDVDIKILVGCAPCQPYSRYSKNRDKNRDWELLRKFGELILATTPDIISMENVPTVKSHVVFNEFIKTIEKAGYFYEYKIINAAEYGVPQNRHRLVLLGSLLNEIHLIPASFTEENFITVKDAIFNMESLNPGDQSEIDPVHICSNLSDKNKIRMEHTPYGGSWIDWPDELKLSCQKKESGKSYKNVYGRMVWEDPSPTLTTQFNGWGTGRFGHPTENRAISLREGALLQSFPQEYIFFDHSKKIVIKDIAKHIGNAVPVELGKAVGNSIVKHLVEQRIHG